MKLFFYAVFSLLLMFVSSCDKDEDATSFINSGLVGTWNLNNSSGGFAGISCDYQSGEVVFVFDNMDNLSITNNVINTTALCGGQEIGISLESHTYGVLTSNDKKFLLVDDQEVGELKINEDQFTLNQNSSSEGSGADLYFLTFVK